MSLIVQLDNEAATRRLGETLAGVLPAGTVVGLSGTLGAGKTRLVQAVAVASGAHLEDVVSPTFVLIHEYQGQRPIYHFDAYRLEDDDAFLELGPEEYFAGSGVTLIEWSDRVARCLPRERIEILLEVTGESSRQATITGYGPRYEAVVAELATRLRK